MKKFRHTNEELARAKRNSMKEELGSQVGMVNDDLKRVVAKKTKIISRGEEV